MIKFSLCTEPPTLGVCQHSLLPSQTLSRPWYFCLWCSLPEWEIAFDMVDTTCMSHHESEEGMALNEGAGNLLGVEINDYWFRASF
jgi:hypothetical protein